MKKKLKAIKWTRADFIALVRGKWFQFTAVSLLCVILALSCMAGFRHTGKTLRSQQIAQEWAGDSETPYAQVSVFLPEGNTVDEAAIRTFREKLTVSLSELVTEELKNLYCDAWSARGTVSLRGEHGSSDATVIAVGGDFFQMHPLELLSGSYISDADLMHDRVLLDEELAWKLFGGYDLTGMTVTIGENTYQVAGVISREDDSASKMAYTDGAGLYMAYDAYLAMNEKAYISCYELVMPSPVEGYAVQQVTEHLAPKDAVVVENSSRYTAENIFSLLRHLNQRTMRTDTVSYPYWENAARLVENRCMVWLVFAVFFWICPVIFAVIITVKAYRKARSKAHVTYLDLKDQYENRVLWANLQAKWKGRKHGRADSETRQEDL